MADLPAIADPRFGYDSTRNGGSTARCLVELNGQVFAPKSVTIEENAHGVVDSATIVLPINGNPDMSVLLNGRDPDGAVIVKVYIGFPNAPSVGSLSINQLHRRHWGIVDSYKPNALADEVTVSTRGMGALLELTKHTNLSLNELTTSYVKTAAALVGLQADIQLLSGAVPYHLSDVYADDLVVGYHNQRIFDTLINCAEVDDVDCWVSDNVLHYRDASTVKRNVLTLTYGKDVMNFEGSHSPQFNKNIKVDVQTYNPRVRYAHTSRTTISADGTISSTSKTTQTTSQAIFGTTGVLATATSQSSTGASSTSTSSSVSTGGSFTTGSTSIPTYSSAEHYTIRKYGWTPQMADDYAKKLALQLSRNEYTATFHLSPTSQDFPLLTIESWIHFNGYPYTAFNTSPKVPYYWPRRITTKFDMDSGLTMEIDALNHRLSKQAV